MYNNDWQNFVGQPVNRKRPQRRLPVLVALVCVSVSATALGLGAPGRAYAQNDRVGVNPAVTVVDDPSTTATTTSTTTTTTPTITEPSSSTTTAPVGPTAVPTTAGSVDASSTTSVPISIVSAVDPNSTTTIATAISTTSTVTTKTTTAGRVTTSTRKPKTAAPARTVEELQQRIDAILNPFPGVVGSISVDGVGAVYDRGADKAVVPASTQKIYSIGAALLRLGAEKRFVTDIRSSKIPSGATLDGDLVIRASGDPSFSSAGVAALADAVARSGIRAVSGDLAVDDSHFDSQRTNDGWKTSFTPGEVGSLSAFTVNGNHQSGKAALDPAIANLALVRAALVARGVIVRGGDRRGFLPLGGPVLGSVTSAPLRDLAAYALKKSENTYAELLLKELGASAGNGSTLGGLEIVRSQFAAFGVSAPIMADGSGLSSLNRTTPRQQVGWLTKLRSSNGAEEFRKSLPIACVDGTLKNRFCNTVGAGKIQAKTGTLDYVTGLTGYGVMPSGRVVVFSFIGNALSSSSRARAAIDASLLVVLTSTVA